MSRVKISLPAQYVFRTQIPVMIGDINYGNHLSNDAVLRLAHEARIRFLKSLNYNEGNIEGYGLILADAEIRYVSQAFHGELLTLILYIDENSLTSSGFELLTKIEHQNGKDVALIKNGIVFFNYLTQQVQAIPNEFLKKIEDKRNNEY
ncbi:esterase [Neisseriaceae bacterium PsAf]|nr:esterase [Neisseriaceae bacterium PsAf]